VDHEQYETSRYGSSSASSAVVELRWEKASARVSVRVSSKRQYGALAALNRRRAPAYGHFGGFEGCRRTMSTIEAMHCSKYTSMRNSQSLKFSNLWSSSLSSPRNGGCWQIAVSGGSDTNALRVSDWSELLAKGAFLVSKCSLFFGTHTDIFLCQNIEIVDGDKESYNGTSFLDVIVAESAEFPKVW
jgi:hypothetical protein